jgi:PIN domain nuclease of toxin-antitoxin system
MIVLDTHIWVWWVHNDKKLTKAQIEIIKANDVGTIGISAISLWEIAKLAERKRLLLPCPIEEWFEQAMSYPGIRILELTPEIIIASTQLPGDFHRDPADQIIAATARVNACSLVTSDAMFIKYPYVETIY